MPEDYIACSIKTLPEEMAQAAADTAIANNPANAITAYALADKGISDPGYLSLLVNKYWGSKGVKLDVGFMEPCPTDLKDRILSHMNAWRTQGRANVEFVWTSNVGNARIRCTRALEGYWAYLGTDNLHIPPNRPNLSLQGFTMSKPESEFRRVVRHEAGHLCGFPHEAQLPGIVADLDVAKTIAWGRQALGWNEQMVRSQILTPLDPRSIRMTQYADRSGIMCYALPASITISGKPIPGGTDIDEMDALFASEVYPLEIKPPEPPKPPEPKPPDPPLPPTGGSMLAKILALIGALKAKDYLGAFKLLLEIITDLQSGRMTETELIEVQNTLQIVEAVRQAK